MPLFKPPQGREAIVKHLRGLRLAQRFAPAIMAAVGAIAIIPLFLQGETSFTIPLVVSAFVAACLFGAYLIMKRLFGAQLEYTEAALHALDHATPQPMVMRRTGLFDHRGSVALFYHPRHAPATPEATAGPPALIATVHAGRNAAGFTTGQEPVTLHHEPTRDAVALLRKDGAALWGRRRTPKDLEQSWNRARWTYLALIALGLLMTGLLATLLGTTILTTQKDMALARASVDWPVATGRMLDAKVETRRQTQGRSRTVYAVRVRYLYKVGYMDYEGRLLGFCTQSFATRDAAEAVARRFASGEAVEVRYSPDAPTMAVLEPGDTAACEDFLRKTWFGLIGGAAVGLLMMATPAGLLLQQGWRMRQVRRQTRGA